jgi:hypothetical protein
VLFLVRLELRQLGHHCPNPQARKHQFAGLDTDGPMFAGMVDLDDAIAVATMHVQAEHGSLPASSGENCLRRPP